MSTTPFSPSRTRVVDFLRRVAPFSIVDSGMMLANEGNVLESSRLGSQISGLVKGADSSTHSVKLEITSPTAMHAQCTCSTSDQMSEQWCSHAVALLWRALELDFLRPDAGFAPREAVLRVNQSSPSEIAAVIKELPKFQPVKITTAPLTAPAVSALIDCSSDRLGIQIRFDGQPQTPSLFEPKPAASSRALDTILIQELDSRGSWDESSLFWYVNASADIEYILGLLQEYDSLLDATTRTPVKIGKDNLLAHLRLEWLPTGAEISMWWDLPNGKKEPRASEIFGTGPFWTLVKNTILPLSPSASAIASIIPHSGPIFLMRSQLAPLLEALAEVEKSELELPVEMVRKELRPEARTKAPTPSLELSLRSNPFEHFSSQGSIEVVAALRFEYPSSSKDDNVVYLPDRAAEKEVAETLKSKGFRALTERNVFVATGDDALDIIHDGKSILPESWNIEGLNLLRKAFRFSEISLNVNLSPATDQWGKQIPWFEGQISATQNNAPVPISALFKGSKADSDRWIQLDGGAFAKVPGGTISSLKTSLGMVDPHFRLSNTIRSKLSPAQALGLSALEGKQITVNADHSLRSLKNRLKDFRNIEQIPLSKGFTGKLRKYQEEGISWLNFLNDFSLGGVLADEMGLGKTVQTLAFLQHLKDHRSKNKKLKKPVLIVCPTSVVMNWVYEARKFTPNLKILLLHGPTRKRAFNTIDQHDLVLTTYALLRLDKSDLSRHEFTYVILDEAQNIKNPHTATTKAAKAIPSEYRLALTGTPTENRPMELWSIIDFLMPGYLGSQEFFRNSIEKPILEGGPGVEVASFLNNKTKPFLLRRTKREVERDLPPKVETVLHVEMTPSQRGLYSQILEEVRPKVFEEIEKKGVKGASVSILAALLRLRQVCNHPNSISALKSLPGFESGKFNLLQELVTEALESGRKILLFTQFRDMMRIIREWLDSQNISHLSLDGTTRNRQTVIDEFNNREDIRLFLISLKAGGTGLNLHSADTVILYDPWWNPAVEDQAIDRAHRIGQTRKVSVYRLVTEESVEQRIMELKSRKSKIVDALVNTAGLSTLKLSKSDIEGLFKVTLDEIG